MTLSEMWYMFIGSEDLTVFTMQESKQITDRVKLVTALGIPGADSKAQ